MTLCSRHTKLAISFRYEHATHRLNPQERFHFVAHFSVNVLDFKTKREILTSQIVY